MFKNASIFRISKTFTLPDLELLEEALQNKWFVRTGPTEPESSGWIPPRGNKSAILAEMVGGQLLLRLKTERRTVPAQALAEAVEERVKLYIAETGRERAGPKLRKEFKEEAMLALLPRAFPTRSAVTLWLDPVNSFLVVDSGSGASADRVVSALIDVLSSLSGGAPLGLVVKPLQTNMSPAAAMAHWIGTREAPVAFSVDRDCELKMPDDQKSTVRYSRHTLETDEVAQHIASGKVPTRLAMTWNSRVSFVLNDLGGVQQIKLLDVVLDGRNDIADEDDGFDTDAAIITGELQALIPDLIDALGGEMAVAA